MSNEKYTLERFMSNLSKPVNKALRHAWSNGEQLTAGGIPREALVNVVILAGYGNRIDVAIVDDFEELLERLRAELHEGKAYPTHPDTFFASSMVIMNGRGQELTMGSFESIGVPDIFAQLFGDQDE
jgi:hypothetical protein